MDFDDDDGLDDDDFADDLVQTYLLDDEYDDFVAKEFDGQGRLRDGPPVAFWIGVLIAALAAVAFAVAF